MGSRRDGLCVRGYAVRSQVLYDYVGGGHVFACSDVRRACEGSGCAYAWAVAVPLGAGTVFLHGTIVVSGVERTLTGLHVGRSRDACRDPIRSFPVA